MSRLTISMPDLVCRESAISELRTMLARAEQSGISDRSLSDVLDAARQEARQKGLLLDAN